MDREEERLARELAARQTADRNRMSMLGMGFDPEEELQQRETTLGAAGAGLGAIPMSGTMGPALDAAARQMQSDRSRGRSFTLGDQRWAQPFSRTQEGREETSARRERDRDVLLAQQVRERDAARATEEKEITGIKTAAEANAALRSRRTSANAEFLRRYSQGKMVPGPYESSPQVKVPLSADEVKALRREVYESYGITPEGSVLPAGSAAPIVVTGEQTANEQTLTRRRDEAIAAVDAALISTAQKARAKARIEAAYQSDLEKLGPRR
jgi:hypothetical protein